MMVIRSSFSKLSRLPALSLACAVGIAFCAACVDDASVQPAVHPVVKQAMFDLNCPRAELRYTRIDEGTWGVEGCGQRAKYVKVCRQVINSWAIGPGAPISDECRWTRN